VKLNAAQEFLGAFVELRKPCISFVMSVGQVGSGRVGSGRVAWNNSASIGWIFVKFDI
jgi:hypothetical protein